MSISTRHDYRDEVVRLQQEIDKLTLLVNEINGLKLSKSDDDECLTIGEALYCAGRCIMLL